MTTDQFISKLKKKLRDIESENTPLKIAAIATHQQVSKRIFEDSLDTHNRKIAYVNPKGKRLEAYSLSYANYRLKKNRLIKEVTFNLTGEFESDYMNSQSVTTAEPHKINANLYTVELRKSKGEISHAELRDIFENDFYKTKIFTLSKQEIELFYKVAAEEFKKQFEL